jgi:NAD(P)-dependent dehydrogenase (short-subunit alcohol dehydrogenase family)
LKGKTVIITGGAGSLGTAAIRLFLKHGANVGASDPWFVEHRH